MRPILGEWWPRIAGSHDVPLSVASDGAHLVGATATFSLIRADTGAIHIANAPATVTTLAGGLTRFLWQPGPSDLLVTGNYLGLFDARTTSGARDVLGYVRLRVEVYP